MNALRKQRGAMAITMALLLIGLIAMLGLIEVGYLYWAHRSTQKVADLAALSGAQQLDKCSPANVSSVAIRNATVDNHFSGDVKANCGYWSPSEMPAPSHFGDADDSHPANAVSVTASLPLTPFFGFAKFSGVKAEAIATQADPIAAFSVGTRLLELQNDGLVPELLKEVGLDVGGTQLVGHEGLANLNITPSGLLKALCDDGALDPCVDITAIADVGDLNSVLAGKSVAIGDLLQAMINLANQQNLADASTALQSLLDAQAIVPGPLELIQLGTDSTSAHRGLFAQIKAATAGSALDADVSALDIANVALQIANSRHFVALNVPIPGVEAKVSVIEPPSIAVGGIGTKAFTSQVRVGAKISTDSLPLVGTLFQALGVTLELPIVIDVVTGDAELTGLCDQGTQADTPPADPPTATFATHTSILDMCVGEFDWKNLPSTKQSCATGLADADIVKLLGTTVVSGKAHIPMLENDQPLTVPLGETVSTDGVDLTVGEAVSNLTHGILELIANNALAQHTDVSSDIDGLADHMWEKAGCTDSSDVSQRKVCMNKIDGMLSKTVSTKTTGLVPGLLDLTNGLLGSVDNLLGSVLGAVTGDGCTTVLLGLPGGNSEGCISIIKNTLQHAQPLQNITGSILNVVLAPVTQLLDALSTILDQVGNYLLEPLLEKLLGDSPGHTDVHLMSVQCKGTSLVY